MKTISLSSLKEKGKLPVLVRVKSTSFLEIADDFMETVLQYPMELESDLLLITSISNDYRGVFWVRWLSVNSEKLASRGAYFKRDHEVIEMSLKDNAEVKGKYEKHLMDNLSTELTHDFSIGSDPEIFVEDENGQAIPAWLFLGSKENPDHTPGTEQDIANGEWLQFKGTGGNTTYWDGLQAEFTTKPGLCMEYHTDSIASGLRGIHDAAKAKFPKSKLSMTSVFDMDYELLQTAREEFVAFGCMPSINAYDIRVNMPPCRDVPFRSAGGHIHFGIGRTTHKDALPIVKTLDAILGVACVSLFASYDDPKRRVLYGLPGEFRLPPHGIEYRPLSNAWMAHPFITNLVFDLARKCVVFAQKDLLKYWNGNEQETIACIVDCDVNKSHEILECNKTTFLGLLHAAYPWTDESDREKMYAIFINGLESVVEDPSDFETNWGMTDDQPWQLRCARRNVRGMFSLIRNGEKIGKQLPEPA